MPYITTNPQWRFTIRIHADVITVVINCFHTRWYFIDDEMLLMMSHHKQRQEANFITLDHQQQKHVLRTVDDVELELVASVLMTTNRNVERITIDFTTKSDKYIGASP